MQLIKEILQQVQILETKQSTPELDAFMKDFFAKTVGNPFARHLRIYDDSVGFETSIWNKAIHLAAIMSFASKGEGEASKALKWFVSLADKHGVPIELDVKPIPNAGAEGKNLTKTQLTAWYKRNGFEKVRGDMMRREPKTVG